jgi:DUF1680 family protein
MRVRWPNWVRMGEYKLSINGQAWSGSGSPGSYVAIDREWRDGDRVEVEMPMHPAIERMPDCRDFAALLYGPIVLGAKIADPSFVSPLPRPVNLSFLPAVRDSLPLETAPKLVGTDDAILAGLQPVAGRPLTFTARDVIGPAEFRDLELIPFFRVHDSRYMLYWQVVKPEESK